MLPALVPPVGTVTQSPDVGVPLVVNVCQKNFFCFTSRDEIVHVNMKSTLRRHDVLLAAAPQRIIFMSHVTMECC